MNWMRIDEVLRKIIKKHDLKEDMYKEAEKHFSWNRSQSEAAINPLINRTKK